MLWDFSEWPEYRGGHISGVLIRESSLYTQCHNATEVIVSVTDTRRFYFVGDEDLLEIIGNSKNVPKLQKHFKKMFAGVATVLLNTDDTCVLGICSKEGEEVS